MAAKKTIKVTMKRSLINTKPNQRDCIKGLGLKKIGDSRELPNTPSIRGMIKKVIHLVDFE